MHRNINTTTQAALYRQPSLQAMEDTQRHHRASSRCNNARHSHQPSKASAIPINHNGHSFG